MRTVPDTSANTPPRLSVLAPDPSGRLFVNDQHGALYRIPDGGGTAASYLDLRDYPTNPLRRTNEAGFQSFAFHPEFHTVGADGFGRLYTIHSTTNTTPAPDFDPGDGTSFHSVLLEWRTDDPTADSYVAPAIGPAFREVLRFDQPFGNHNTGLIAFNPTVSSTDSDYGNLYVAVGDGGSSGDPQDNGQTLSNPYGAIMRIDPLGTDGINGQYGIVADNVFAQDAPAAETLAENYAGGLRNPQRFGWDPVTGAMYIADIGQGAIEEINLGQNGANYGLEHSRRIAAVRRQRDGGTHGSGCGIRSHERRRGSADSDWQPRDHGRRGRARHRDPGARRFADARRFPDRAHLHARRRLRSARRRAGRAAGARARRRSARRRASARPESTTRAPRVASAA